MNNYFETRIGSPDAPARLKGCKVMVSMPVIKGGSMKVKVDLPPDVTNDEAGWVKQHVQQLVEKLRARFPGMVGRCEGSNVVRP